jgi:GAF domain-containing protein
MTEDSAAELLAELARVATDAGPAIAPVGRDELLLSITDAARELFGAAACSLALLDDSESELVFHVASGAGAADVIGKRTPLAQGIGGWVVMSGQAIAIEDVRQDPRFASDFAAQTGYVPHSILAMPLETERRVLGVIEVLDRRADAGHGRDMELLSVFARQAALAIEGTRVFTALGRELLRAVAAAATAHSDLAQALEQAARDAPASTSDMAELAALFSEIGHVGAEESAALTRIAREFLAYARARRTG